MTLCCLHRCIQFIIELSKFVFRSFDLHQLTDIDLTVSITVLLKLVDTQPFILLPISSPMDLLNGCYEIHSWMSLPALPSLSISRTHMTLCVPSGLCSMTYTLGWSTTVKIENHPSSTTCNTKYLILHPIIVTLQYKGYSPAPFFGNEILSKSFWPLAYLGFKLHHKSSISVTSCSNPSQITSSNTIIFKSLCNKIYYPSGKIRQQKGCFLLLCIKIYAPCSIQHKNSAVHIYCLEKRKQKDCW